MPRLVRLLRADRTDVVMVTHHNRAALTLGRIAARLAGVPANVVAAHDMDLTRVGGRVLPRHDVETLFLSDALVLLAPSQGGYLREEEGVGRFPWRRTREVVVGNGIVLGAPPDRRGPGRGPRAARAARDRRRARHRGPAQPAEGAPRVARRLRAGGAADRPELRLVVVGGGERGAELRRQVASCWASATGCCSPGSDRDVPQLLPGFDVSCLSSVHEGVPLTVLEAMAAGLPVVSTRCGALRDMVTDREEGFLVPVGDTSPSPTGWRSWPTTRAAGRDGRTGPAARRERVFDRAHRGRLPATADRAGGAMTRILILVENLSVPFDRRVWQESRALVEAGYDVVVICPTGNGRDTEREIVLDGVRILRYPLRAATGGPAGYVREYGLALWHTLRLAWRVRREGPVHVVQACNPPDLLFLAALPLMLRGAKFVFDHHDLVPELFRSRFAGGAVRRSSGWRVVRAHHVRPRRRRDQHQRELPADRADPWSQTGRRRAGGAQRSGPEPFPAARARPRAAPRQDLPGRLPRRDGSAGRRGLRPARARRAAPRAGSRRPAHDLHGRTATRSTTWSSWPRNWTSTSASSSPAGCPTSSCSDVCPLRTSACPRTRCNPLNDLSTMNKVVEYMAMGRPIVSFDLTEAQVSAGEAAVYAADDDERTFAKLLSDLLDDPVRRAEMGEIGRTRVAEQLSWATSKRNLLGFYERLVGPATPALAADRGAAVSGGPDASPRSGTPPAAPAPF